jgi:hypothetical protein
VEGILIGQRVWVADAHARWISGVIASISDDFLNSGGFIVLLDGETKVVTCCEDRRGTQWDFATDSLT